MLRSSYLLLIISVILFGCQQGGNKDLASFVDPFIGTSGHGHTYPGATMPFGMVQLSPDTRVQNWDACSGYHTSDSTIIGFSHTHLSGTGAIDYGDILFMPTTGEPQVSPGEENNTSTGYRSAFRHETEKAEAGYYAVKLDDYDIDVELTATERTGFHKYTYNEEGRSNIILDLKHDLGLNRITSSGLQVISNTEIAGWRHSAGWANDQKIFFIAQFSKAFTDYNINTDSLKNTIPEEVEGDFIKAWFTFDIAEGEEIMLKVGISAVNIEGARKNLETENSGWNFNMIKRSAREEWNKILELVNVETENTDDKTVFYTALYHSFLAPNLYIDVDGQYRGMDQEIHKSDRNIYTVFSLWDTFRATHPLFTILKPELAGDLVNTMITKYEQSGLLPVWELAACETGCMIGYHSISVIADAIVKGIVNYDIDKAYKAMKKSAMENHLGLEYYKEQGFIPVDKEHEGVSKTLEYAYDDWCIAVVAKKLGYEDDFHYFINRAQFYKNVYDRETGFMRGKRNGIFVSPFDPGEVSGDYTEANSWQYSYFVPQDVSGLVKLVGNDEKFEKHLDKLFSADEAISGRSQPDISGMIGQYAHGNEPSHHMAYLYNFVGVPYKTQELISKIRDDLYTSERDGLCGNEDCGQMSSWYVFSALGFYPVTPGKDYYVIGTHGFESAQINLPGNKAFKIVANNFSETNIYIQSAILNGKPYDLSYISHSDIMKGGTLEFEMGPEPNKEFGYKKENRPVSEIVDETFVEVPVLLSGDRIFSGLTILEFEEKEGIEIYYSLDNTAPDTNSILYDEPIIITGTSVLKAVAVDDNDNKSMTMVAEYTKIPEGMNIQMNSEYSHNYNAGGDMALIDQQRGDEDFMSGKWQGWQGIDLDAIIDLGRVKTVNEISLSCLADQDKWIFFPEKVEYLISGNGIDYESVGYLTKELNDDPGAKLKEFPLKLKNKKVRYIHLKAQSVGICPEWHRGAGGKAWIFADELLVR